VRVHHDGADVLAARSRGHITRGQWADAITQVEAAMNPPLRVSDLSQWATLRPSSSYLD
jgi:hypothetical protein